jgi:RNA polymerase-binding transcription factor
MGTQLRQAGRFSPAEPYMSSGQLDYFQGRLLRWREVLLDQERGMQAALGQAPDRPADPVDQGVQEAARLQTLEKRLRTRRLLREIDAALARIEDGSYGYCLESGEEIGLRRLDAVPTATLSVEMQEQVERRQRFRQRNQLDAERISP